VNIYVETNFVLELVFQQEQHVYCEEIVRLGCFLNRNYKDFSNPDIIDELNTYNCRTIFRFDQGLSFIKAQN